MTARITGLVVLAVAILTWGNSEHPVLVVAVWVGFLVSAYLLTQAPLALTLTMALLGGAHLLNAEVSWQWWTYGAATAVGALSSIYILLQRFRQRIADTKEARWQNR